MIGRVISVVLTIVIVAIITVTMHAVPVFAQTLIQPPRIEFHDGTKKVGSRLIEGETKVYAALTKEEAQFVRAKLLKIRPNSSKEEISAILKTEISSEGRTNQITHKGKQVALNSVHWWAKTNPGRDKMWRINNDGQVTVNYINGSIYKVSWIKQMGSWSVTIKLLHW